MKPRVALTIAGALLAFGLQGCASAALAEPRVLSPICSMDGWTGFCDSSFAPAISADTSRRLCRVVYLGEGGPYDEMLVRIEADGRATLSYDNRGPAVLSSAELAAFEAALSNARFEEQPTFGPASSCLDGAEYVIERVGDLPYKAVVRDQCTLNDDGLFPAVDTLWKASKRLGLLP